MRTSHADRWIERLERALALLSSRLDDPPSLGELAAAAGSSPYHFHRIWRLLTGEPVNRTIARLRIAAAQQRLAEGATVTDTAMDGGFGTPQSFARAFRRMTGLSPSEFLAGKDGPAPIAPVADAGIRIELRPARQVVALRREGGAYRELNALFQSVWDWAAQAGALSGLSTIYGIPYDDPASVAEPALRYDAALALGPEREPPSPLRVLALPAGRHAVLRHVGSYDGLEDANQSLMAWAIASGHQPGDFPLFHHFLDDPEETPAQALRTDVLLLLQPEEPHQ